MQAGKPYDPYLPQKFVQLTHPQWIKDAVLYEVNVRQFSVEGTFDAVEKQLPRLKKMGVSIIWLMPVHPIGEINRKGSLGSYYAVKDFYGINSEFGTGDDFHSLIKAIHSLGMYVILDWVAHHSSVDNSLVHTHPHFYARNADGQFISTPWRDYDDVYDFNFDEPELRQYMTEAMLYWIREFDIDGFRCDLAGFVPVDFWEHARKEFFKIKPVFMLAEADDRDLHRQAFDATYAWQLWNILHNICTKNAALKTLTEGYIAELVSVFPNDAIRINFTDNHDKNSWEGNMCENFGAGLEAAIVLTALISGMPLVYNGQEAGLCRSLQFFERDVIEWKEHYFEDLYTRLFTLKKNNKALWNASWGGDMVKIVNSQPEQVLSFSRTREQYEVLVIINMSNTPSNVILNTSDDVGNFTDFKSGEEIKLLAETKFSLEAWAYVILYTNNKK